MCLKTSVPVYVHACVRVYVYVRGVMHACVRVYMRGGHACMCACVCEGGVHVCLK